MMLTQFQAFVEAVAILLVGDALVIAAACALFFLFEKYDKKSS